MRNNYKKLSSHGSINIPVAMRREMGLLKGDPMEVSLIGGVVTVKPYMPRCIFCGTNEAVYSLQGKHICAGCAMEASAMVERNRNDGTGKIKGNG